MYMRILSVVAIPFGLITTIVATAYYVLGGLNVGLTEALLWYFLYGHIMTALVVTIFVGIPLAVLAVVISGVLWLFTLPARIRLIS
jgi:hypothetical protein